MTSLSMRTSPALFCAIFTLFFLEIRSEISVLTPAEVASRPITTEKTKNTSEKPFAHSLTVTGTETLGDTSSTSDITNETEPGEEKSATFPKSHSGATRVNETKLTATEATATTSTSTISTKKQPTMSPKAEKTPSSFVPISNPPSIKTTKASVTDKPVKAENPAHFPSTTELSPLVNNTKTTGNPAYVATATELLPHVNDTKTTGNPAHFTSSTELPPLVNDTKTAENATHFASTTELSPLVNNTQTTGNPAHVTTTTELSPHVNDTKTTGNPAHVTTTTELSPLVNDTKTTGNPAHFTSATESLNDNRTTTEVSIRPTATLTTTSWVPTTNASSNATEGLIPVVPKISTTSAQSPTEKATVATTGAPPCSSIGVVKHCLIVIAALAAVATVFIICTVALCTKLSSRKYKLRRQRQGTEMLCISSLMPERSSRPRVRYSRQRSPTAPNGGVLVFPNHDDSDDELGDNLTLSSFLPDSDHYV